MKYICLIFSGWLLLLAGSGFAQNLYSAQNGSVTFYSKAPLEDIEAKNSKAQSVINRNTGEIAVKIPIRSFIFSNGLMQEHFNENYMESGKYPFATFKGRINETIDWNKDGTYPVTATGKMNIHGVEQDRTITGKLQVTGGRLQLDAGFPVALADHNIKIPTVVFQKIAETIAVTTQFIYQPHVKQ
jgi:hypothetical protein